MDPVSYTSSSESRLPAWLARLSPGRIADPRLRFFVRAAIFFVLLFALDRLGYRLLFANFDRSNRIAEIRETHDIVLVGSSHVLWDFDRDWIEANTPHRVGMLSAPGANIELRRAFAEDHLRLAAAPPRLLVVEADKYVFNKDRYQADAWRPLAGYYPSGILRDYLGAKLRALPRRGAPYFISHLHCYNSEFHYIGFRLMEKVSGPLAGLGPLRGGLVSFDASGAPIFAPPPGAEAPAAPQTPATASGGPDAAQTARSLAAMRALLGDDPRLVGWRESYARYDASVDTALNTELRALVEYMQRYPQTILILLETPNLPLVPEREAEFDRIRALLAEAAAGRSNVRYLRIEPERFERDVTLFLDASHMGPRGRIEYSAAFLEAVRELLPAR